MKKLITEKDIIAFANEGRTVVPAGSNTVITPLALDKMKELGLTAVDEQQSPANDMIAAGKAFNEPGIRVAVGSDHAGFKLKNMLADMLKKNGYRVIDVGTFDEKSCDYPDFAYAAAEKVRKGEAEFALLCDATGTPSAMVANKVKGIRAAACYNEFTAASAREHNNANVIVLGARMLGEELCKAILKTFLVSSFAGDRHQKRLDKLTRIENLNLRERI